LERGGSSVVGRGRAGRASVVKGYSGVGLSTLRNIGISGGLELQ